MIGGRMIRRLYHRRFLLTFTKSGSLIRSKHEVSTPVNEKREKLTTLLSDENQVGANLYEPIAG